jgi:hypothetical protein
LTLKKSGVFPAFEESNLDSLIVVSFVHNVEVEDLPMRIGSSDWLGHIAFISDLASAVAHGVRFSNPCMAAQP